MGQKLPLQTLSKTAERARRIFRQQRSGHLFHCYHFFGNRKRSFYTRGEAQLCTTSDTTNKDYDKSKKTKETKYCILNKRKQGSQ